jgi:pyruvate/2-oxoglutarate dehydrogenase complex dihydrolipoamide acyltransferase (E2) component
MGAPVPSGGGRVRNRWIPFWGLQISEVIVGIAYADTSIHVSRSGVLIGAAVAYFALAVTARGPLGIFRLVSQKVHVMALMAVSAVVAISPVLATLRPDIEGILVLELGAVGLIRLATLTQTAGSSPRPASGIRSGRVIDATATPVEPAPAPGAPAPAPGAAAPASGAAAPASGADALASGAARWAGRAAGAATASGKRAAAKYGPEAEKHVKRTIRGAGRIAGKAGAAGKAGGGPAPAPPSDAEPPGA